MGVAGIICCSGLVARADCSGWGGYGVSHKW